MPSLLNLTWCGSAGGDPALASSRLSGLLALEIARPSWRPKIDRGLRDLIRQMSKDNPLWGAPRIHGELLKLGFEIAESTVSKYMSRVSRILRPAKFPCNATS